MSNEQPTVHQALSKVMESVRSVAKKDRNEQQRFLFRGIDAVMNAVGPALRAHGVIVIPEVLEHDIVGSQSSTGKAINVCRVKVRYTVYGPAGDSLSGVVPGEAMDSGDKTTAKAMSVAYRTFLLQALTLPTDETDPDAESYEAPAPAPARTVTRQRAKAKRDYLAEIPDAGGDKDLLRVLWAAAKADGEPTEVLDAIQAAAAA